MSTDPHGALAPWDGTASAGQGWRAAAADGSQARLAIEGTAPHAALRLDFALSGHGAWAIVRLDRKAVLPRHYVVVLSLRGDAPPTELQVKLVGTGGADVWWWRRRPMTFTRETQRLVLRRAALEFAWGPAGGGDPPGLDAIEIALAADDGRTGTLWIDELRLEPREAAAGPPRVQALRASSHAPGHAPECARAPDSAAEWRPDPSDPQPWIDLDLGARREWGGVVVQTTGTTPPPMRLLASDDGIDWSLLSDQAAGTGTRRWLRSAEAESRWARVEFPSGLSGVRHLEVVPLELAVSPARYAQARARAAPRGAFPRHLLGEQGYWAVVGGDGGDEKGLLGEDGALEIAAEAFSIEPFLWRDGRLLTWADVHSTVALADRFLPVPSVQWTADATCLRVTGFVIGSPEASTLVARYELTNAGQAAQSLRLLLAIRPYQVNPAWQSLNMTGGVASIVRIETDATTVRVNDTRQVTAVTRPDTIGVAHSDGCLRALEHGTAPSAASVDDPTGFAEAVLRFDVPPEPGARSVVAIAIPYHASAALPAGLDAQHAAAWVDRALDESTGFWRTRLGRVPIELPPSAAPVAETLRASLGWILVNREGPRIQPGPRCYRRSWIRDGALTSTALAEMGFVAEARDFLRWYAPHQYDDGRVPCAVDRHGVDPVPEHDSHGQLVWSVIEIFRLTEDRAFLAQLWPRLVRAVDAIAALRATRTTEAFRGRPAWGLLPESISHEGYSSRPVHSYWDDFFAVRALADAAWAAGVLGDEVAAGRFAVLRDAMRRDLHASIVRTIADHGLDVLPGSVEHGDFDPTSTAIAFDPCDEAARLPAAALRRTFERYWLELDARRLGRAPNDGYSPYEIRNATALTRLGWRTRALDQLAWLIGDQRPPAWRQWPEIAWRDARAPRFLGDLPHGWVASSFVRTVRRLVAYERHDDGTLVLAAGLPHAWVQDPPGIAVHGLATHFGSLDFTMQGDEQEIVVQLGGTVRPPGGIVVVSPSSRPLRGVVIDGTTHEPTDPHRVALAAGVASLRMCY